MKRDNNFDFLRLVFALSVVCYHGYALSREPALAILAKFFNADLAVKAFFVVSGYLVVMSCERSSSFASYASKRVRRIYPAYFAIIVVCATAGAISSAMSVADYARSGALRYLGANLVFLNFLAPVLPGIFESNTMREVNGALWTLKIEVMFYALVPLLVLAVRRLKIAPVLAALYAASIAYALAMGAWHASGRCGLCAQLEHQLPAQLTCFLVGSALYLYRREAAGRWPALGALAVAAAVADAYFTQRFVHPAAEPMWLGIAVVYAACEAPYLGNFARFGDLSYGTYIIHFPVIQTAVTLGWFARDPWPAFVSCVAITLAAAYASWHVVEKPFLSVRSHYRAAEGAHGDVLAGERS